MEDGIQNIGMVVDQVLKVEAIAEEQMNPAPDIGKRFRFECIRAVSNLKDEFILILNIENLFRGDDLHNEPTTN